MSYRDGRSPGSNNNNNLLNNRAALSSGMNSDSNGNNLGDIGNAMGRYYNGKGSFQFENNESRMMNDSNGNSSSSAMMAYNNAFNNGLMMSPQQQQQQQQQYMYQQYASQLAATHHSNNPSASGTSSKSYLNPLMMQYGAAALNVTDAGKEAGPGRSQEENLMIAASVAASGLFVTHEDTKGKKRKKAKDKPKRPLSAYNIFFKHERAKILNQIPDTKKPDATHCETSAEPDTPEIKKDDEPQDPSADEKDDPTSTSSGTATANRKKKSTAKKKKTPHGKISFESLAKEIGSRWKNLSEDMKEEFKKKAQEDTLRYSKEMEAYAKKVAYQANENMTQESEPAPQRVNHRKSLDEQELQSVKEAFSSISKAMDKDNSLSHKKQELAQDDLEKEMSSAFKRPRIYKNYDQTPAAMMAASYSQQHQHQQFQQQMNALIPQYPSSGSAPMGQQTSSQQMVMGSSNSALISQYNQMMMGGGGHDHGSGPGQQQHHMQQQLLLQQQQQIQQQMQSVANWQNYGFHNANNNSNNNNNNVGQY